jgi:membrane-associated phospholipid phosphatase
VSPSARAKWLVIAVIVILDGIGLARFGMHLSWAGLERGSGALVLLVGMAGFYTYRRPNERIADIAHTMALIVAFFAATAISSYLVAATNLPLVDAELAAADRALGFDWPTLLAWVRAHPTVWLVLDVAYRSAIPQLVAIALYLAFTGQPERNSELLWTMMLSLFVIVPVSALLPAGGAWVQYDAMRYANVAQVRDFLALRSGALHELDLPRLEGLINFPSFHTVLGVIFIYVLRRHRILCAAAGLLNAVMIASVLTEGGHYLVDVISGVAVAMGAIWVTARLESALARPLPETTGIPARI